MTRVEAARLALRDAEIALAVAMATCDAAMVELREARAVALVDAHYPRPVDERSMAERVADGWRGRGDVEVLP